MSFTNLSQLTLFVKVTDPWRTQDVTFSFTKPFLIKFFAFLFSVSILPIMDRLKTSSGAPREIVIEVMQWVRTGWGGIVASLFIWRVFPHWRWGWWIDRRKKMIIGWKWRKAGGNPVKEIDALIFIQIEQ
jgi:hypothetical protein